MTEETAKKELTALSREELREGLESGEITIEDIRENDEVRRRVSKLLLKKDMEEHRDIYDRLAEV